MTDNIEAHKTADSNTTITASILLPDKRHGSRTQQPASKPRFAPRIERLLAIFAEIERQAGKKS
jgi:hypothetical protein